MSTVTLTNLRDYLYGTLTPQNMLWLSAQLAEYANRHNELPHYTMDDINAMLDKAEADIAAGRLIDDDDAWDELEKELALEGQELEMAEAI